MEIIGTKKKGNMNVKWLVEADVFDDNQEGLLNALKNKGIEYQVLKYIPFDDDLPKRCLDIYGPEECVVFYGSLNFGHKLRKLPWVPGVYLNEKAFECTSYYPHLKELLLHHNDYIMMPYGDLVNHKTRIFKYFDSDSVFIRPNSGLKQFTGMICHEDDFFECVKLAGFYDVEPELLVLISKVHPIEKEWRFVIADGEPVCGSLYRDWSSGEKLEPGFSTKDYVLMNSHSIRKECEDKNALMLAYEAAKRYDPDKCWTMDIAKTEYGTYEVLEIGCFSGAGLYANDLNKVVEAVSKTALDEWKEYFNKE
jgi:hypothetical protein